MAAQTTEIYPDNVRSDYSDEIDLRRYLLVLLKWWREILLIVILAGVLAGVAVATLNNSRTPLYEASADLIIARLSSNIELDERISTTSGTSETDVNAWRASLLQLVKSSVVANQVLEELDSELPAGLRKPDALLSIISAEVPLSPDERSASNLIRVTAETSDPTVSAQIANSWARHLVTYINGLYGEVPEAMIESVMAERDQSLFAYQTAQKGLEEFVGSSQIDALNRQIGEKMGLRDELVLNHSRMISAVVSTEYNSRIGLYKALVAAPAEQTRNVVTAQLSANVEALELLYTLRGSAMTQLNQARNMERSLVAGGAAAAKSNVSALQLLKLAAFSSLQVSERLPVNLSFISPDQDLEMSLEEQLADVRALVAVFEDYVASLDDDIEALAQAEGATTELATLTSLENHLEGQKQIAGSGVYSDAASVYAQLLTAEVTPGQLPAEISSTYIENHEALVTQLEGEIRSLQAALSAEEARELQLTHQRDQAWTTYETVGTKLQELNLLRSSANSEVRLGNPALPPTEPSPQLGLLLPVAAALIAGFLFAVLLALIVDSVGGSPLFARRPV
ncbi:MAG: hypothetical protein IT328_08260 [Caldilineaceae bacterium]|nr:hypothetical protein [Caldilineaceae bacterium]